MYVCMVTHIARVWINRVRLPASGQLNREEKKLAAFASENLVSRDVSSRVRLLIAILRLNLVHTYGIPLEFCGGVYIFIV